MSNDKKSFVLYHGMYTPIKHLSLENKGLLLEAFFDYNSNGIEPAVDSPVYMAFLFFKNQFDLDLEKYKAIVERNKSNGSKSGGRPKTKETQWVNNNPNEPKKADKDKGIEKGNDNEKDFINKESYEKENMIDFFFREFPNSSHLERIAMTLKVSKEELLKCIPDFKKSANLEYQNIVKFSEHFKNWYLKRDSKSQETNSQNIPQYE